MAVKSLVKIMKGKRAGKTFVAQTRIAFNATEMYLSGETTIDTIITTRKIARNKFAFLKGLIFAKKVFNLLFTFDKNFLFI